MSFGVEAQLKRSRSIRFARGVAENRFIAEKKPSREKRIRFCNQPGGFFVKFQMGGFRGDGKRSVGAAGIHAGSGV